MEKCVMGYFSQQMIDNEPSEQELQQESLAGAHEYQAECEYKASKEHQEYLNILASGE
jgi:hypothetical protein